MKRLLLATALAIGIASSARATEIDFSTPIIDAAGSQFTDCAKYKTPMPGLPLECETKVQVTLGYMAYKALNVPDQSLTYSAITERGDLARQVYRGGKIDISTENITTIKNLLPKTGFVPVAIAGAIHALDSVAAKDAGKK